MADLEVAKTIIAQIGSTALYMIGAKGYVGDNKSVKFRIMRNKKRITHIKITLNGLDLYDMEFYRFKKNMTEQDFAPIATENGCYDDMLCAMIEKNTELYTKL